MNPLENRCNHFERNRKCSMGYCCWIVVDGGVPVSVPLTNTWDDFLRMPMEESSQNQPHLNIPFAVVVRFDWIKSMWHRVLWTHWGRIAFKPQWNSSSCRTVRVYYFLLFAAFFLLYISRQIIPNTVSIVLLLLLFAHVNTISDQRITNGVE